MNQFLKGSLITGLILGGSAWAFTPIQGPYIGFIAEGSHGPNTEHAFTYNNVPYTGTINYDPIGGGGGFMLGFRIRQFRIEGEALYNRMSADSLKIGNCTLLSPTLAVPTGGCPNSPLSNLSFNGSTSVMYGLINGYFDFGSESFENPLVPYLGLGIGYAQVKHQVNFVFRNNISSAGASATNTSTAAQFIVGTSYFMDDFTWAGFDYRYLTTNTMSAFNNTRFGINSLNFTINFSFDRTNK